MNVVYNMDCMEYMRTLHDKAFDLAVVDPPYGIGEDGGKDRSRYVAQKQSCGTSAMTEPTSPGLRSRSTL